MGLGVESFGEDELNKLETVQDYRENGISGKNGEHPFLMKGLQTASVSIAERISPSISQETALRFPIVLFGSFTVLLIFLLVRELFGPGIGVVAAGLWAFEPMAIGFDRVAKEDSLVLFFFLLTNLFWLRGQSEAERGNKKWTWYAWAAAAGFAALMASKYYPFLLGITGAYYIIFRVVPERQWDMRAKRWFTFFAVMGLSFLILNPTILLPETWREMLKFSSEKRIGHDSYEFMGELYRNQMSAFLNGVPWTFFFVFAAVKTSLSTLVLFLAGLPLLFRRKLADGRFFILFWAALWLLSYTFIGGKFTRYFTTAAPLIFIAAAVAFVFGVRWLSDRLPARLAPLVQIVLFAAFLAIPLANSLSATPHFRLFTNTIGGGMARAGTYFPHDEFYDLSTREVAAEISRTAATGATIASETPALFEHYVERTGRTDLRFISLSDPAAMSLISEGDVVVWAMGRRYFSNTPYLEVLQNSAIRPYETKAGAITSARIYLLDASTAAALRSTASGLIRN